MHPEKRQEIYGRTRMAVVASTRQNHSYAKRPSHREPTQNSNGNYHFFCSCNQLIDFFLAGGARCSSLASREGRKREAGIETVQRKIGIQGKLSCAIYFLSLYYQPKAVTNHSLICLLKRWP